MAREDLNALRVVPGGPWTVLGGVFVVAVAFGLLRVGIDLTYAESVPFLVIVPLVGLLGWTLGVALVVLYGLFELIAASDYLTVGSVVGRLISYGVLYLLVVTIPSVQRATYAWLLARLDGARSKELAGAASAVVTGGLVYCWAVMAPYLVRPVFGFSESPYVTSSRLRAITTLQSQELLLAAAAFVAALVVALAYQRRTGVRPPPRFRLGAALWGRTAWVGRLLRYGLVVALLAGFITDALDVVLLAGALIAADLVVPVAVRVGPIRRTLPRIPRLGRFLLAFGVTLLATLAIIDWRYRPLGGSEFFPLVLSITVGLFVFRCFLDVDEAAAEYRLKAAEANEEDEHGTVVSSVLLVALGTGVLLATVPGVAVADDCSDLSDCASTAGAAIATGLSALSAAVWFWIKGVFAKQPPVVGQLEPLLSEEGAAAQRGAILALQDKFAKEYLAQTGDIEMYYEINDMSIEEFIDFVQSHRFSGGGFSVSGSAG